MAQQQPQQAIHKFVLGNKELEGKTAEFQYDKRSEERRVGKRV